MIISIYIYIYYMYIYVSCEYHIRHRTLFKNQKAFVQPSEGTPLPLALATVSLLVGDSGGALNLANQHPMLRCILHYSWNFLTYITLNSMEPVFSRADCSSPERKRWFVTMKRKNCWRSWPWRRRFGKKELQLQVGWSQGKKPCKQKTYSMYLILIWFDETRIE